MRRYVAQLSTGRSIDTFSEIKLGLMGSDDRKDAYKTGLVQWAREPVNLSKLDGLQGSQTLKTLIKKLDGRCQQRLAYRRRDGKVLRVLIAGGGPIGLRAAIEMATLGHAVTVLETHDACTRLNALWLWDETIYDFNEHLGLQHFGEACIVKKPGKSTVSTSRLQLSLLKVALLLGVKIRLGGEHALRDLRQAEDFHVLLLATGLRPPLLKSISEQTAGGGMRTQTKSGGLETSEEKIALTSVAIVAHYEACAADDASKAWLKTAETFDWQWHAHNFPKGGEEQQKRFKEKGPWAISKAELHEDRNAFAHVQNIVCYPNKVYCKLNAHGEECKEAPSIEKSVGIPSTYYFVMTLETTPKELRGLLLDKAHPRYEEPPKEVLDSNSARVLLDWAKRMKPWPCDSSETRRAVAGAATDQRDMKKLEQTVHSVVSRFTANYVGNQSIRDPPTKPLPEACRLLHSISPDLAVKQSRSLDIFDYSGTRRMDKDSAAAIVTAVRAAAGEELEPRPPKRALLVLPIGDALQEPFWPQGLGINRGLLNALDASWVANAWQPDKESTWEATLQERNRLYASYTYGMEAMKARKSHGGKLLDGNVRDPRGNGKTCKQHELFTVDPSTRYDGCRTPGWLSSLLGLTSDAAGEGQPTQNIDDAESMKRMALMMNIRALSQSNVQNE